MKKSIFETRLEILLLFITYIIILPRVCCSYDFQCWQTWALSIYRHGLTNVYSNEAVNYHPIFLYVLYVYDWIQGSEEKIIANLNYVKIFFLVFDFLPVVVLCCFKNQLIKIRIPYCFLLLNIAYLYNSMIWGQLDSVHTSLVFLSLLVAFSAPVSGAILFALAICTKLQAIIFLPFLLIIFLYSVNTGRKLLATLACFILTFVVTCFPFIIAGKMPQLLHVATAAVGFYPFVTQGAFNFWHLVSKDAAKLNDYNKLYFISYKHTGQLLFMLFSSIVIFPFLFRMIRLRLIKEPVDADTQKLLFLAAGLIALFFFYFNTEMHERYSHPMLIFFFFYSVLSRNYTLYILASLSYLINLSLLIQLGLPFYMYEKIFNERTTAILYTATVIVGLVAFLKRFHLKKELKQLVIEYRKKTVY